MPVSEKAVYEAEYKTEQQRLSAEWKRFQNTKKFREFEEKQNLAEEFYFVKQRAKAERLLKKLEACLCSDEDDVPCLYSSAELARWEEELLADFPCTRRARVRFFERVCAEIDDAVARARGESNGTSGEEGDKMERKEGEEDAEDVADDDDVSSADERDGVKSKTPR